MPGRFALYYTSYKLSYPNIFYQDLANPNALPLTCQYRLRPELRSARGKSLAQQLGVSTTVAANGSVHASPAAAARRVIDPTTNAELVKMLESVVATGTGVNAAIDGYTVAGKTGTAQIPNASQLGYVPGAFVGSFIGAAVFEFTYSRHTGVAARAARRQSGWHSARGRLF